jgi:hypothetical protein
MLMEFVKNYKNWIDPMWIEEITNTPGLSVPKDIFQNINIFEEIKNGKREPMDKSEEEIYKVYGTDLVQFQLLEKDELSFKINPPWVQPNEDFTWWIVKMYPGQYIPVHRDNPRGGDKNTRRYWMPLTEHDPGHIFVYEDITVSKYDKGDLYLYNETQALHGAINIGSTTRIILQVSAYYKKDEVKK